MKGKKVGSRRRIRASRSPHWGGARKLRYSLYIISLVLRTFPDAFTLSNSPGWAFLILIGG